MISLGNEANVFINQPDTPDFDLIIKINLRQTSLRYLQQLCLQIKQRFNNFENNYFDHLECIGPDNAFT